MRKIRLRSDKVVDYLLSQGITKAEMGRRMGMTRAHFGRYTLCDRIVGMATAQKFIKFFGEDVVEWVDDDK